MLAIALQILICAFQLVAPAEATGTIQGVVIDGAQGAPVEGVEVILRTGNGSELVPVAESTTDFYGRYSFSGVALDPGRDYLPGADRSGVHYPGPRVRLSPHSRVAYAKIVTYETVAAPCPLVAARHQFDVSILEGVMEITETMLVINPTRTTFVGQPAMDGELPVTLRLTIPKNFDRVTFGSEFHGRRFRVVDHRLVTDIPWPPGERELLMKYRIPIGESAGVFRRPLDLPCSDVQIRVRGEGAESASCNLPKSAAADGGVTFAATVDPVPAGYIVELRLGALPVSWGAYARWTALLFLALLVLATVAIHRRRAKA